MDQKPDSEVVLPEVVMIAAVARNGVIGAENDMPWKLPTDLKHFKKLTLGKPVVMGRKTFLSFGGRPLPGRPHVIISRNPDYAPQGAQAVTSLEAGLKTAKDIAAETGADEIIVMGGGQIYAQAMPFANRLEITEVDAEPDGDTRFPEIDPDVWKETARTQGEQSERDTAPFAFVTYLRAEAP